MGTKNISTLIASLPKPTSLQFSYPKDWTAESTSAFGALADGDVWGALKSAGATAAEGLSGDRAAAAFFHKTGTQINQRNKAIFKDLPFREVSFAWSILPTDAGHATEIMDFIKMLKIESAPRLSKSGAMFDFPTVFELEIKSGAGTLFRSDGLALTNLTVDYTPSGFWSQHIDGFPTKINFAAEFKEITLAIRENLEGGETARLI